MTPHAAASDQQQKHWTADLQQIQLRSHPLAMRSDSAAAAGYNHDLDRDCDRRLLRAKSDLEPWTGSQISLGLDLDPRSGDLPRSDLVPRLLLDLAAVPRDARLSQHPSQSHLDLPRQI